MMNYKETIFFIGKCLTISYEKENLDIVSKLIKNNKVNWDQFTQIASSHYVVPTLFCLFKKHHLIEFLPKELSNLMHDITEANRERNQQIYQETREINNLLKENNITPIFLKGAALIQQNLYNDIAERMIGDIDFVVPYKDYLKSAEILLELKYQKVNFKSYSFPSFKHFHRLSHSNKIAAVEVHKELLLEEYADEFNYQIISENTIDIDGLKVMSYANQLNLTIIASQINDRGNEHNSISLRNAYDAYLLSNRTNSFEAISNFKKLFHPLNNFLAIAYTTLNSNAFQYNNNQNTKEFHEKYTKLISDSEYAKKHHRKTQFLIDWKVRFHFLQKSLTSKHHRNWMYHRVRDKEWQQEKLVQLKLKKPKSSLH